MITCWVSMLFAFCGISSISLCTGSKDDKNFTNIFFFKSKCPLFNLHVNFIETGLSNFCKHVVFWVETQCSLVGGYECFGRYLWLCHQGWIFNSCSPFNPMSEGSIFLWNSGIQIPDYMVSHVKRLQFNHHCESFNVHCL